VWGKHKEKHAEVNINVKSHHERPENGKNPLSITITQPIKNIFQIQT
jgi:hypothetical protein